MSDDANDAGRPDPWSSSRSGTTDTFDLLGTEIASLLRNTNELTEKTRREAAVEAEARLAAADAEARARLAAVDREVQSRMGDLEALVTSIARREEAAAAVFDLATELVDRLERRADRIAAESRGATDEIAPLRAALRRGAADDHVPTVAATPAPEPAAPAVEVIDLRESAAGDDLTGDDLTEDDSVDEQPAKRKGKHKRRRQRERA